MPMIGKTTFKCFRCKEEISDESPNRYFFRRVIKHLENHQETIEQIVSDYEKAIKENTGVINGLKSQLETYKKSSRVFQAKYHFCKAIKDIISNPNWTEIEEKNDNVSLGLVVTFFDPLRGPFPIIFSPEILSESESMLANLASQSFSRLGFVRSPDEDRYVTFPFQFDDKKLSVLGYAFGFDNPEARGGQDNLNICFIIKPPWGNSENLDKVLNQILAQFRSVGDLMKENADVEIIQEALRKIRIFFTWKMLFST